VAFERIISVKFDRIKSKNLSKWICLILFIILILTYIHDPIHRQLIDDIDINEKRLWCFVKYSSSIEIYDSFSYTYSIFNKYYF
jgi:hypothetical protein